MTDVEIERRSPRRHNRVRRRLRDFIERWGDVLQVAFAAVLVCLGVAVALIALSMRSASIEDKKNSVQAAAQSKAACERTRLLGPYSARFLIDNHVYPTRDAKGRNLQKIALGTIPKTCN